VSKSKCAKPTYVLAGPGAGKTHGMVEAVAGCLSELSPHRNLAVIAYTHAATKTIRERLAVRVSIPPNVFIGTTHSFVARFLLKPFGSIVGGLPEELIYTDVSGKAKVQASGRAKYLQNVLKKGVMDYADMLSKSAALIEQQPVRSRVGGRLQYLFVDEFQDISPALRRVLDAIRKEKKTVIRVVGDPEQFINSFAYKDAGQRVPEAKKLPHALFAEKAEQETNRDNRRANGELVDFANQFRSDFTQTSSKGNRGEQAVFFLKHCDKKVLIAAFQALTEVVETVADVRKRLYLAKENGFFDDVRAEYGIVHIGKEAQRGKSLHADARELLAVAVGKSERTLVEGLEGGLLAWRQVACSLLRLSKTEGVDYAKFKLFVESNLKIAVSKSREGHITRVFDDLRGALAATDDPAAGIEVSSSLHKSKGLEADAVLVVARTQNELRKLLENGAETRKVDKSDACRLGYVGITRARERLFLGALVI